MGYIIQTDEVALAVQAQYRQQAIIDGYERALALKIATEGAPNTNLKYNGRYANLKARAFDYVNDIVLPTSGAVLAAGLAGWLTMPLLVVGNPYSVFANNTPAAIVPQVPQTQVWVFYKYCIPYATTFPVTYLIFTAGQQGQFRKDEFELESTYAKLSTDGFFSDPVVYDKAEFAGATVRARIVTGQIAFVLQGWVIEPRA
jgi:hypothetical protein